MSRREAHPALQSDTVICSGLASTSTESGIVSANPQRVELTITNVDTTNAMVICPGAAVATPTTGIKLAIGASWTTRSFTGAVRAISLGAFSVLTVVETF